MDGILNNTFSSDRKLSKINTNPWKLARYTLAKAFEWGSEGCVVIETFLANNTKGFEARKELFEKITNELYYVFYENKKVDFDVMMVFEEWINQVGFLGDDLKSLRILFFIIQNPDRFLDYHIKGAKGCLFDKKWLEHWEELTNDEAKIIYKFHYGQEI